MLHKSLFLDLLPSSLKVMEKCLISWIVGSSPETAAVQQFSQKGTITAMRSQRVRVGGESQNGAEIHRENYLCEACKGLSPLCVPLCSKINHSLPHQPNLFKIRKIVIINN